MIQRVLNGWNIQRVLFTGIGLYVLVDSIYRTEWIGIVMGAYFSAMGLFGFGCAACINPKQTEENPEIEVEYEEVVK